MSAKSTNGRELLAKRLKEATKGRSKTELAAKLGVSRAAIYDWINTGRISDESLFKLCAIIGADPMKLKFDTAYKAVQIDIDLLRTIVIALERYKAAGSLDFEPSDYAALIASFYEIYAGVEAVTAEQILLALRASATVARTRET